MNSSIISVALKTLLFSGKLPVERKITRLETQMAELHESGEDYLESILILKKENGIARAVDVAKRLGVSKPSVSRAVGILTKDGYIEISKIGALELTEKGQKTADEIYARHLLLTDFLVKITGVSREKAEENACRIEHDIDPEIKAGIENWMKNS